MHRRRRTCTRAHGRFDDEAQPEVTLFDPSIIRWGLIGAGLVVAAATGAGIAVGLRGRAAAGDDGRASTPR